MNTVFADTSFCAAIFSPHDTLHDRAKAVAAALKGSVVTTEFVLVELGNFFCRGNARCVFQTMMENLRTAEDIEIGPASGELFRRELALFTSRPDKDWSLTDCISFSQAARRSPPASKTPKNHNARDDCRIHEAFLHGIHTNQRNAGCHRADALRSGDC